MAKIPTLAAYERARRALRVVCEPNSCRWQETVFGTKFRSQRKEKTDHRMMVCFSMAAELGFEPRHTESESAVLPLHNSARLLDFCYRVRDKYRVCRSGKAT